MGNVRMTTADDLHRLLAKAHAQGCELLPASVRPHGYQVRGSDARKPPYTVLLGRKLHGCDCDGYERHGRCKHYALALDDAGLLPDCTLPQEWVELTEKGLAVAAEALAHELTQMSGATTRDERRAAAAADLDADELDVLRRMDDHARRR